MSTIIVDVSLNALSKLVSGNIYVIPNGVYKYMGVVCMIGNNITVKAATPGGVTFTGGNVSFDISGNNNTLTGIQLVNTSAFMGTLPKAAKGINANDLITVFGNNHTVSYVNINAVRAAHFVNVYGTAQNFTMNNCNIQNKVIDPSGVYLTSMVQLLGDAKTTNSHRIHHCTWQGMTQGMGGDNGCECIRIGDSIYSTCNLNTVVEYCVFDNTWMSDSETISVKSMNNIIRYNTFSNNIGAFVSFRNGNNNLAYGNFHINSSGVRFKQASNVSVYNSYFYQCDVPVLFVNVSQYANYKTLYHANINIQHNTFYNCNPILVDTYPDVSNNVLANNIIYQDGTGPFLLPKNIAVFTGYYPPTDSSQMPQLLLGTLNGFVVQNNLILPHSWKPVHQCDASGNQLLNASGNPLDLAWTPLFQYDASGNYVLDASGNCTLAPGFVPVDPKLQMNTVNYYSIMADSPAVGAAAPVAVPLTTNPNGVTTDANIALDVTAQTRIAPNDVGCSQFTITFSGLTLNRPLSLTDVGTMYTNL